MNFIANIKLLFETLISQIKICADSVDNLQKPKMEIDLFLLGKFRVEFLELKEEISTLFRISFMQTLNHNYARILLTSKIKIFHAKI